MTRFARSLATTVTILVVLAVGCMLFFERVQPMDIGVRQSLWGGGISQEDFTTGTYLGITGVHKWHYLPRRTHFLHFTGAAVVAGSTPPARLTWIGFHDVEPAHGATHDRRQPHDHRT